MKITSITKFKHGILREALVKLGWSQSDLARKTGISISTIGHILNLQRRPCKEIMDKIQLALGKEEIYIDVLECWPEEFTGSGKRTIVETTHDFDPSLLLGCQKSLLLEQQDQEMLGDTIVSKRTAQKERLYKAMDTLDEREKEVLIRTFINGETLAEIGKNGGVNQATIAQIRNRGLNNLADVKRLRIINGEESEFDECLLKVQKEHQEERALGFTRKFMSHSQRKRKIKASGDKLKKLFPHIKR